MATDEEHLANANSKTLYGIFCDVKGQEFKRISKRTTAKETWDILITADEGKGIAHLTLMWKLEYIEADFWSISNNFPVP
ncbi:hypothetical protein J1N35_044450 [Gossypium stocksii]|uniref:Uncharacterized protein n=1 Tax=Gossypium stocksii TaxID=47602 RepID=A0A9D3U923_9ROSI|nr:hypothetical protein J1N35_044450 [Gossypium stocksii]